MAELKPRYTPAIRDAISEVAGAAKRAAETHDLSANEMLIVITAVASDWLPPQAKSDRQ